MRPRGITPEPERSKLLAAAERAKSARTTPRPEDAQLRMAHHLGMPVDMLFETVVSKKTGLPVQTKSRAGQKKVAA